MTMRRILALTVAAFIALPAYADGFVDVKNRDTFMSLMNGRKLTRFGINLVVTPDGRIDGRAFGWDVTGAWNWQSGYFCRDLYLGGDDLGRNCQAVKVQGRTVRFISDLGAGDFADFTLRGSP